MPPKKEKTNETLTTQTETPATEPAVRVLKTPKLTPGEKAAQKSREAHDLQRFIQGPKTL